jgi:hypothetical protein
MRFLVQAKVKLATLQVFGQKLQAGALDRSCIRSETYCLQKDPSVGYSVWEAGSRREFDKAFEAWRVFYDAVEIDEVISPLEAMQQLMRKAG